MAELFLDISDVHAVLKLMGSTGVADEMGISGAAQSLEAILIHNIPYVLPGAYGSSSHGKEEDIGLADLDLVPYGEICL